MVTSKHKLTHDEKLVWTWVAICAAGAITALALGVSRLPAAGLSNWFICAHHPDTKIAMPACATLLDSPSGFPETWLDAPLRREAALSYKAEKYDRVISDIKRLEAIGHATQLDLNDLGLAFYFKGNYAEARGYFQKAISAGPPDAIIYANIGHADRNLADIPGAAEAFRKSVELAPADVETRHELANSYFDLERYDEALVAFDATLKLEPKRLSARVDRGWTLIRLDRPKDALDTFERYLEDGGPIVYGQEGVARAQLDLGNWSETVAAADKAIAADRQQIWPHYYRGSALWSLDRLEEARKSYDDFLALRPDDVDGLIDQGQILWDLHAESEALADLDRAVLLYPNTPAYLSLAPR